MEFTRWSNKNGGEVRAHVVTDDEAGMSVEGPDGRSRTVNAGEVLVETYRPGQYDVAGGDFTDNYTEDTDKDSAEETSDATEQFDPDTHTAAEVREYLSREDLSADERTRVETAERGGKNRASAFPA